MPSIGTYHNNNYHHHHHNHNHHSQYDENGVLISSLNEFDMMQTTTTTTTTAVRTKLYVTNFPEDMDQDEMKKLFNQYGDVLECTIMWNQYAFVHFGSYEEAEKAMLGVKGSQYKGNKLSVQWSTSSKYQQPKQHQQQQQQQHASKIQMAAQPLMQTNTDHIVASTSSSSSSSASSLMNQQHGITKILERPNSEKNQQQQQQLPPPAPPQALLTSALSTSLSQQPQSWAAIMNTASPINATDINPTVLNGKTPTPNNKSPSATKLTTTGIGSNVVTASSSSSSGCQFKISFSEIVRSSNTNTIATPNNVTVSSNVVTGSPNVKSNTTSQMSGGGVAITTTNGTAVAPSLTSVNISTTTSTNISTANKTVIPQLMATTALPLSSLQTNKSLNKAEPPSVSSSSSIAHQSLSNGKVNSSTSNTNSKLPFF
jgi:hypothetical protein